MAKCRGCGIDTSEYFSEGLGWMHFMCEISRLDGLLEEAKKTSLCYQELDAATANRIRALEAEAASLREQLAAARQYPPDMERPQLEPPSSKNDEARRWADYAAYVEHLFVAQNFKLGETEAKLTEAKNYLCGFLWFLDERALIRDISDDDRPDFYAGAARFTTWISRAAKVSGRDG